MLRLIRNLLPILSVFVGTLSWGTSETFRGEATVASATVLGIGTTIGDTGKLPSKGGALQTTLATVNIPLVLSGVIAQSEVVGVGDHTDASTTLASLNLLSSGVAITADLIQSHAYAKGSSTQPPITSGSSQIVNLVINGVPVICTGAPNQVINLGVGTVTLNQITPGMGSITVIAVHVSIAGVLDVQLGKSFAAIGPCNGCSYGCSGSPNCTGVFDFLLGGGSLLNSVKLNAYFAVALGLNNGQNWGSLVYNDPNSLVSLVGTTITQYTETSSVERVIQGNGLLNGITNVTYTLDVLQTGTQTWNFTLTLSTGYTITGSINLGFLDIRQACN
jgi:hypothetical protein